MKFYEVLIDYPEAARVEKGNIVQHVRHFEYKIIYSKYPQPEQFNWGIANRSLKEIFLSDLEKLIYNIAE